jgi:uncharacterized protein YxjI
MEKLAGLDALVIRQKKEWGEILSGFETRNSYAVMDPTGAELFAAAEVGGSFLGRNFLKSLRPFTIHLVDLQGNQPFRFYFQRLEVAGADGRPVGSIQRRFSLLRRIFTVQDAAGNDVFELFGPILHPWTFQIRQQGMEIGKITKKWSGLFKEAATDADNFGVTFPSDADVQAKALLLGAVFLIDFCYFEDKGGS